MKFLSVFLLSFTVMNPIYAEVKMTGGDDVLINVSAKLKQIEEHMKNQRVFVTPASFTWNELNDFREELMFVAAHDPSGPVPKETPENLLPSQLTQKLRASFDKLEASVIQIGSLIKSDEWTLLKADIEQFIKFRSEFLYVPARAMIRSGELTARLDTLKNAAAVALKGPQDQKNVSVRVIDPVVEKLAVELQELNHSVAQLEDLRKPKPVEIKTIFQDKNAAELIGFGLAAAVAGAFLAFSFVFIARKFKKAPVVEVAPVSPAGFDYHEWLKRFETNLKALKHYEDNLTEQHINMKTLGQQLSESRKGLNLADNQQDYYECLEQLNSSAPKLEEYFEKINLQKNSDLSRRMVKLVVQLCDALETRQEIVFSEAKGKLKIAKVAPEAIHLNAA